MSKTNMFVLNVKYLGHFPPPPFGLPHHPPQHSNDGIKTISLKNYDTLHFVKQIETKLLSIFYSHQSFQHYHSAPQ